MSGVPKQRGDSRVFSGDNEKSLCLNVVRWNPLELLKDGRAGSREVQLEEDSIIEKMNVGWRRGTMKCPY